MYQWVSCQNQENTHRARMNWQRQEKQQLPTSHSLLPQKECREWCKCVAINLGPTVKRLTCRQFCASQRKIRLGIFNQFRRSAVAGLSAVQCSASTKYENIGACDRCGFMVIIGSSRPLINPSLYLRLSSKVVYKVQNSFIRFVGLHTIVVRVMQDGEEQYGLQ